MKAETETVFTLSSIFNLGKVISSVESPGEVIKISVLSLMGKLKMKKGVGFVADAGVLKPAYSAGGVKVDDDFKINPDNVPLSFVKLNSANVKRFSSNFKDFISKSDLKYLVPIRFGVSDKRRETLALILLGGREGKLYRPEIDYINFISNFTAVALKNIFSILDLKRSIYNLLILNEFMQSIFLKKDEEEILNSLALTLMGHFKVKSVALAMFDRGKAKFFLLPKRGSFPKGILRKILKEKSSVIKISPKSRAGGFSIAMVNRVPESEKIDVLLLNVESGRLPFENEELELMQTFFYLAMSAVENLKVLNLNYDMKLAYEIQQNLLPKELPKSSKIDICALTLPSRVVSGDYYDVICLSDDEFIVVIADVCGKGLSASLLMSNLQASLRSFLFFSNDVVEIVKLLNKVIIVNTSPEQFITFFICKVDLKNSIIEYVNAGHNPPILFRDDEIKFLDEGGSVLGVFEGEYKSEKFKVREGDLLFFYTDGVTEAVNQAGEELGVGRIIEVISSKRRLSASKVIESVKKLIFEHIGRVEQTDDITIVALRIR